MRVFALMLSALFLQMALLGCGAADSESNADGLPPLATCGADTDCPMGLRCEDSLCVDEAGLPPEAREPLNFQAPVALGDHLLIASTDGNSVAILDPIALSIESIPVPAEPVALAALPDGRAAVILSRAARTVSLLELADGNPTLKRLQVGRAFERVSVSLDGSFALLWTPDGVLPPGGTEGLLSLVDLDALAGDRPTLAIERVAGRRHTEVFFRGDGQGTADAVVVAQSEIAIFDLTQPEAPLLRIPLPASHSQPATRDALPTPDGSLLLIRSLVSPELLLLDVANRTLDTLTLPGPPSDLVLSVDGSRAVVVIRELGEVIFFKLPDTPAAPVELQSIAVALPGRDCGETPCAVSPGRASLSRDGRLAALFTNAAAADAFAFLDLDSGALEIVSPLHKLVDRVVLAPDGGSALVLHQAEIDPTVSDPYEREVRRSQGYSVVDLPTGRAQLQLTGTMVPGQPVFPEGGSTAAIPLADKVLKQFRLDGISRETLVVTPHPLASAPEFAGPLPSGGDGSVWVTQTHPLGRISFLDVISGSMRTLTGFALHGEIE